MIRKSVAAVLVSIVASHFAFAQAADLPVPVQASGTQAAPKAEKALVPLKIVVTLARYEGEKKTSSLPFTLWVNANDEQVTTLNVGSQVAVPQTEAGPPGSVPGYQYRNVGTYLTSRAWSLDDGRYRVQLSIRDSSVSPSKDTGGKPTFQSFETNNFLLLRDGQTAQFVGAIDKVTGEVTRVEVNAAVLK